MDIKDREGLGLGSEKASPAFSFYLSPVPLWPWAQMWFRRLFVHVGLWLRVSALTEVDPMSLVPSISACEKCIQVAQEGQLLKPGPIAGPGGGVNGTSKWS